jgi:hypothetical protein
MRDAYAADDPWRGYRQKFRVFFREAKALTAGIFVSYRAGKIDHYVLSYKPAIGSDNPASRNHPLRVSPGKGSNQIPYKTDKPLISEPIFFRQKESI